MSTVEISNVSSFEIVSTFFSVTDSFNSCGKFATVSFLSRFLGYLANNLISSNVASANSSGVRGIL